MTSKTAAVFEVVDDAKEAYHTGTVIDWTKEKIHIAVEKVRYLDRCVHDIDKQVVFAGEDSARVVPTCAGSRPLH